MTLEITTDSPDETETLGRRLAGVLRPGDIVLMTGSLGCGKTVLAAGIADGLGVDEPVVSPSFVLVKEYKGFLPLVHADVYRLSSTNEFEDLELVTMARDGVLLIEWGNAVEHTLPADHLVVDIAITGESTRMVRLIAKGDWDGRIEELST